MRRYKSIEYRCEVPGDFQGGLFFIASVLAAQAPAQEYLSPCAIDVSPDGALLYVTAATGKQILYVDARRQTVLKTVSFPAELSGLEQSRDGKTLYVTGGGHNGKIFVADAASGEIRQTFSAGHTPVSPVLSPDGRSLYVCHRFSNEVAFIDLSSGKTIKRIPVTREPVAMDITPDGRWLFVANLLPAGRADAEQVAAQISAIDIGQGTVSPVPLANGSVGMHALKVSPDGRYVYATHIVARFQVPTTQLERGWVSTAGLSVIRVADRTLLYTVLLDDVDLGFPDPWAIGFSEDGRKLLVSSAGAHELSVVDLPALTEKISEAGATGRAGAAPDAYGNLSFLSGIRDRIPLKGLGPRAIAVQGGTAYVANFFSDTLSLVDLSHPASAGVKELLLGPVQPLTAVRRGEIGFNDATLCFQQWLSCATCHPDARADALNWDLLNDGIGNPKNAKSMLWAHRTPPAMWLAVRPDAETAVRSGMIHIQFATRPAEESLAIDEYLKSLAPVPSPFLVDGKLSGAAVRGQQLFGKIGCSGCHPAPLFTSLRQCDVGTARGRDQGLPVDVPSLVECWRTAPYLHDGRAATLHELFRQQDHSGIHPRAAELSERDLDDLIEYVSSL